MAASSRGGRRGVRTGRRDWLWALAAIAGVFVVVAAIFALATGGGGTETKAEAAGVKCQVGEQLNYHVHTFLAIEIEGQAVEVPPNVGIRQDCLFWLHTHSPNGILHVEAPEETNFTLGQFFAVWGQPLSETQLMDKTADAGHQVQAAVDGEPWEGDPAEIPLDDKTSVVLQYGPPFVEPPTFDWGE